MILTRTLDLPEFALRGKLDDMAELFTEWVDTLPQPIVGDHIAGVVLFRRWLKLRETEVETERRAILDGHNTTSNGDDTANTQA